MQSDHDRQNSASEASLHAFDYWQVLKNRYGVILLTFLLIFMTAAVITYVLPKKYESVVVLQVNPSVQEIDPLGGALGRPLTGSYSTRAFMLNEFEIIKSEQTLTRVLDRLDLSSRWNGMEPDTIVAILKGIVKTEDRKSVV